MRPRITTVTSAHTVRACAAGHLYCRIRACCLQRLVRGGVVASQRAMHEQVRAGTATACPSWTTVAKRAQRISVLLTCSRRRCAGLRVHACARVRAFSLSWVAAKVDAETYHPRVCVASPLPCRAAASLLWVAAVAVLQPASTARRRRRWYVLLVD